MNLKIKHLASLNTIKTLYTKFYWLLKNYLIKSLQKTLPETIINKKHNLIMQLFPKYLIFNITNISEANADTLQPLYPKLQIIIPFKIIYSIYQKSLLLKSTILELPKFDLQGTFILKGLKRGIISKLIKINGIYFSKRKQGDIYIQRARIFCTSKKQFFIELTNKNIFLYTNSEKKICLITFLHFLGLKNRDIISISRYGNDIYIKKLFLKNYQTYITKHFFTTNLDCEHYLDILQNIRAELTLSSSKYNNKFFKQINNFNKIDSNLDKNHLDIKLGQYHSNKLLAFDLLLIVDFLLDLKYKKRMQEDLDDLGNRKLESIGNIIQDHLEFNFKKLFNSIKNSSNYELFIQIFNTLKKGITKNEPVATIKELFYVNPLLQYLDQINSVSELMHKIKISSIEPGSQLIDVRTNVALREIRSNQLGKLCILDTTEGSSSGLILSLTKNSRVTGQGYIETFIKKGIPFKRKTISTFLNTFEQESIQVTFKPYKLKKSIPFNEYSILVLEKGEFKNTSLNKSKFTAILPLEEILSFTENLIPFIMFNDPARCLMGARMQAQSVPLIYNQKPIVLTGSEASISTKIPSLLRALQEGIVLYVDSSKIIVRDLFNREITYYIQSYQKSNQGTLLYQQPIVWPGERINVGQLLTRTQDITEIEFNIGNNLSILYGTFFGYEFEDAVIINKQTVNKHIYTSLHFDIYETTFSEITKEGPEVSTNSIPKQSNFHKRHLDIFGFVKEGSQVLEGDILLGKISINKIIISNKAISNIIYTLFGTELQQIYDKSIRLGTGNSGRVVKVEVFTQVYEPIKKSKYLKCRIFVCKQRTLNIGDKLCSRHGNKGVVAYIAEPSDLPYTNSAFIPDIITSPLGVPSRMNLGQLFESILGFYGVQEDKRILLNASMISQLEHNYLKSLLYNSLFSSKNKQGNIWLYNPYIPGKINIRDGRNGYLLKGTVLLGTAFYSKLIHMVKDKIHYRTIGPYTEITQQPIKGRANYGGQRFGEMEVWALEAYGASYNLRELLTYKSDDLVARTNMQQHILNEVTLKTPTLTESFRLMLRELNGLTLNIDAFALIDNLEGKKIDLNVSFM